MSTSVSKYGSFDDFAHSEAPGWNRSGGGDRLKNWKKEGRVVIWLPLNQPPILVRRHPFPIGVERDNNGEKTLAYWSVGHLCWESEATLRDERKRNNDGSRVAPPESCPLCKMQEWLYQQVKITGEIDWLDDVFAFSGATEAKDNKRLKAGGILGFFGSQYLKDEEKDEMQKAGIYAKDAWSQKTGAKPEYLFCVVDNDAPEKGIQVAFEPSSVGEAVKDVLAKAVKSRGAEGSYARHPFAIELNKNPKPKTFSDFYEACPLEKVGLTVEMEEILRGGVPDISKHLIPFNGAKMRAMMEKHALIDMPFDEFFSSKPPQEDTEGTGFPFGANAPEQKPAPVATKTRGPARAPKVEAPTIPCDVCKHPMLETDTKCAKCGAEYGEEEDEAPPPPPPWSWSEARKAKLG